MAIYSMPDKSLGQQYSIEIESKQQGNLKFSSRHIKKIEKQVKLI